MAETTTIRGLCATCDCGPECGWRLRAPDRVVFHCEEFHCEPGGSCGGERSAPVAALTTRSNPPRRGRDKGLCMNCESRDDCTFRIPEGGVWRCEEYR